MSSDVSEELSPRVKSHMFFSERFLVLLSAFLES
jgi:hypothetical protein